jgi:hypothetical protein|tara:strand:- start:72 stop:458 length:387 start_codon:yes stop_codon:yes gene_type:complete
MLDLKQYKTNWKCESALYKGIPISERQNPVVRELMKTRLFSVKYRGISKMIPTPAGVSGYLTQWYERPQGYCHKHGADTFAIYPYSNYKEYKDFYYEVKSKNMFRVWEKCAIKIQKIAEEIVEYVEIS